MYYCCGITEKGVMPHNEDAMLVGREVRDSGVTEQTLPAPFFAAVSDGVSGELSGELASMMCLRRLSGSDFYSEDRLKDGILSIHRELAEYSKNSPEAHNMQCTLCGIAIDSNENITAFNIGDSRLYRFRDGRLRQLSRDQSLVQLLYEEGTITREELKTHARRNIIFPALGNITSEPTVDTEPIEGGMQYGDILLLCTDGLSDYISTQDIQEVLELPKSLYMRLQMLVDMAMERKCQDNISVIAIVYKE